MYNIYLCTYVYKECNILAVICFQFTFDAILHQLISRIHIHTYIYTYILFAFLYGHLYAHTYVPMHVLTTTTHKYAYISIHLRAGIFKLGGKSQHKLC